VKRFVLETNQYKQKEPSSHTSGVGAIFEEKKNSKFLCFYLVTNNRETDSDYFLLLALLLVAWVQVI